jgi:CubicO group peptidase (beta-lactamase class C family)
MQLVEQRKIALDSAVGVYLPTLPAAWRGVTVRQLLNHTSGIPSYTGSARWRPHMAEPMAPDSILSFVAADTLDFAVGSQWRYNNSGYVLLGMLLDKVTGQPYPRYMQSRLFGPLGLRHTSYCEDAPKDARFARGFNNGVSYTDAAPLSITQPYSAGALCATASDIARWNVLLATGKVVSPASYAAMTTPMGAARVSKYGFGLTADTIAGRRTIGHGGAINGFRSANIYVPSDSLSITVLANSGGGDVDRMLVMILRAAYGLALEPQRPKAVTLSAAERAPYAGSYTLSFGGRTLRMRIFEQDGKLVSQAEGQGVIPLIAYGNHVFGADFDPNVRIVFTVAGAQATKLTLHQGGTVIEGPRDP